MFFKQNIPTWVRNFPVAMDKEALTQLAKASTGPFDKPREMNFCLYSIPTDGNAEAIVAMIAKHKPGWQCEVAPQADVPDKLTLTVTKNDYRLTEDSYMDDSTFFQQLADTYHVEYDGWFASS